MDRHAVALAVPNAVVAVVWGFTAINDWALHVWWLGPAYLLTLFGGGLASTVGFVSSVVVLCGPEPASRSSWVMCLLANVAGALVQLVAFVVFVAPGC